MHSQTIHLYPQWVAKATPEDVEFVDAVYAECEDHYSEGGDVVVETHTPQEVLEVFKNGPVDVRAYCKRHLEQALNARLGEDNDPELARKRRGTDPGGPWAKQGR
jgi:hypothetical protein